MAEVELHKVPAIIRVRADTEKNWKDTVLLERQIGMVRDKNSLNNGKFKVGDGETPWDKLRFVLGADGRSMHSVTVPTNTAPEVWHINDLILNAHTTNLNILGITTPPGGLVRVVNETTGTAAGNIRGPQGARGPFPNASELPDAGVIRSSDLLLVQRSGQYHRANANQLAYTFVIDSDVALRAWATNAPGNNYSRILIRAGSWAYTVNLSGGTATNPVAAINISDGRTLSVVGESGSKISIRIQGSGFFCGIRGRVTSIFNNPGNEFFFENVNIETNRNFSGEGIFVSFMFCSNLRNCTCVSDALVPNSSGNGFRSCLNLDSCIAIGTGSTSSGSGTGAGFLNCQNLTNCISTGYGRPGYGFQNCQNLTNCTGAGEGVGTSGSQRMGVGFLGCQNLVNCSGVGWGIQGFGFQNCRTGFGCRRSGASTTATFSVCSMEQGSVSNPTPWGDTALGGYNLP